MSKPSSPPSSRSTPPSGRTVARRLLDYLKQHRAPLTVGLVCGVGAAAVQTSIAKLLQSFIDGLDVKKGGLDVSRLTDLQFEQAYAHLRLICILIVVAYLVMGLLKYGQSVFLATVAQRIGQSIRRDVYTHLQSLSLAYFHRRRTGALLSTLTSDVNKLQVAAMLIKDVVTTPVQIAFAVGYMAHLSPRLTLFAVLGAPLIAWAIQKLTRRIRGISKQTQERLADVTSVMEETLSAPRIVRAFTAEQHEIARFNKASEYAIQSQLKAVRRTARLGPTVDLMGAVGIALVLFLGGTEVLQRRMTTGELLAVFALASNIANQVNALGSLKTAWEDMMGAADRLFEDVLDVQPDVRDLPNAYELPPVQGRIQFENVSFGYLPDQPVLSHLNLTVEPGEVVALVGETGAGKTTLADLIPRFYDPTEGRVTVDGHDLWAVRLQSLRRQIAIVPQETLLFSGTLRENIVYGRRDALDAEVHAAARAANIAEFIESLPDGYETWIGERGTTLSGGQRQRIAIARALLADPRILILDEATSALDAQTESLVQDALETLMEGRTTIIIAHRLSTVVNADKIVVLKRGGIIAEMGTHAQLMARGGVYAGLFEAQRFAAQGGGAVGGTDALAGAAGA